MLRQESQEVVKIGIKCLDCGNNAKRGCVHLRCRTCCKNKGFQCQTHVKSTWAAAERRHREPQTLQVDIPNKRHKLNPSSGFEERNQFPESLSSIGIFRRVRVHSRDGAVDEEAYQASVNIGGHLFCGILYDQGPPKRHGVEAAEDSLISNPQQQNLSNAAPNTSYGAIMASSSAATAPDDSVLHHQQPYPPIFNSFKAPVPPPFFDLRK